MHATSANGGARASADGPLAAIVIPSWNTRELLSACLGSLAATRDDLALETIVVDNGSTDGSAQMVRAEFPDARVIQNTDNVGFARACNQGIAATTAPYVLLLNSDARVVAGSVRAMVSCAQARPRSAVVGGLIRNEDGSFQASFIDFPSMVQELLMLTGLGRLLYGPWYPSHDAQEHGGAVRVAWVTGAAMLVRRAAMTEVGGFDERFFMYAEEMDLCCRCIRAGWEVWYEPGAVILHLGGASSRSQPAQREIQLYSSRVRFYGVHSGRWHARLAAALIVAITAAKRPVHALVRRLSGGRRGRTVAPPIALWTQLRKQL